MTTAGLIIYDVRIQKGMTQRELARSSGIPQPNLSRIEKGRQDLSLTTLVRIAAALGVAPARFLETPRACAPRPLTRELIEKIANAAAGPGEGQTGDVARYALWFRQIFPKAGRGRVSTKRIERSWLRLKERFTPGEIRNICQRIRERGAQRP